MAYGGSPTASNTDGVRLMVGDISTSATTELLSNADYTFFLTQGNIWIASQLAANSLAARAASSEGGGVTSKSVGDLSIQLSGGLQDAQTYAALSKKFGRMAAAQITPYAGGQSRDDKAAVEADTDRVRPLFKRGEFRNPAAITGVSST
jgi:hypothetical protein